MMVEKYRNLSNPLFKFYKKGGDCRSANSNKKSFSVLVILAQFIFFDVTLFQIVYNFRLSYTGILFGEADENRRLCIVSLLVILLFSEIYLRH